MNVTANEEPGFHSKFGGLWIDRFDWRQQVTARNLSVDQQQLLTKFVADGYIILEGAASHADVDAFQTQIEKSFREGNEKLLYQQHGSQETRSLDGPVDRLGTRVVDSFVPLTEALTLFSSPRLLDFLNLIFDADPLLFQSLSFDQGSQQGLHQDTAYVVVQEPLQLAACWIALEDVQAGSGELIYAPGSHRLPDWNFGGNRKHWKPDEDGFETHNEWGQHLVDQAQGGRGIQRFLAKKGDILVWHADLAHGGSPVEDMALTRQSLVGHFCPQTTEPYFFSFPPYRTTIKYFGRLAYCSQHYDL